MPDIDRHLAFRDYLRRNLELVAACEDEKVRCLGLHPDNLHEYGACKSEWLDAVEAAALADWQNL